MGNCLTLYRFHSRNSAGNRASAAGEQEGAVVQVVKMDGRILEFAASIHVKDLLVKVPGPGVGFSAKVSECLPLSYELKLGNMYFLFPLFTSPETANDHDHQGAENVSPVMHTVNPRVIKTIKVVITKKQLEDLVSKEISLDNLVSEIKNTTTTTTTTAKTSAADSPRAKGWQPVLESIPEGNEFDFSYNKKGTGVLLSK